MVEGTAWGPLLFEVLTPILVLLLAGLIRALTHQAHLDEKLKGVESDVKDVRGDVRWLIRRLTGRDIRDEEKHWEGD